MRKFTTSVEASLRQVGVSEKQQIAASQSLQRQRSAALISQFKAEEREAARTANTRLREEARAVRQRIAEESRAAREVARITAETARQAIAQERIRERAARQLADAQIREAKRAARELEASLKAQGGASGGFGGGSTALLGVAGRIPGLSSLTSELSALTSATQGASAAQGSLAGPIGIATAAAVAQIGVVFKLHQGLFDLARSTAQFQGNLFDMSQQVGVSVETLSTLEVLATTTGGNIESVAGALGIFQKNLEASHDPTSKEAKLLAELGVTSSDTEEALAQTLQGLFKLGDGSRQTAAVLELFGRSGRFVNAILKESEGDLDRAKAKFSELGIVISTENARAADHFNDSLALLQFQLRGLTAQIGNEVIPIITGALKGLGKTLEDNRDAVDALGVAVKTAAGVLSIPFFSAISTVDTLIKTHRGEIELLKDAYESLSAAMQLVTGNIPQIPENLIPPVDLQGEKSGVTLLRDLQQLFKQSQGAGFDSKIFKPVDLSKLEALFKKEGSAAAIDPGVALLRQLQSELRRLTTDTKAAEIAEQLLSEQFKNTSESLKQQIVMAARVIDARRAQIQADESLKAAAEELRETFARETREVGRFLQAQAETLRQLKFGDKTELDKANDFIKFFDNLSGALDEATKRLIRFNALSIDSARSVKAMLDLMRESADLVPGPAEGVKVPEVRVDVGIPPPESLNMLVAAAVEAQDAFAGLGVVMSDVFGLGAEGGVAFADALGAAFSGLAQAAGEAVRAFILFGEVEGGFRKFAAEVIASIAQMAVVNAIWEAAQGLAMLALTWFTGNPKYAASAGAHFAAAAAYGIVAGVAVPLGRAVAGDTFKQPGGAGGGTSDNDSRGPQQLNPLEFNRNQPQPTRTIVLQIQSNDSHIVKVVGADIRSAGQLRELILNDESI